MKEIDIHSLTLRIPFDLYTIYKKAALYSRKSGAKKSITEILNEALESRKTFVEKKYIPSVDR